jgi:hypothetical protein
MELLPIMPVVVDGPPCPLVPPDPVSVGLLSKPKGSTQEASAATAAA